jgi:hypothetical protein
MIITTMRVLILLIPVGVLHSAQRANPIPATFPARTAGQKIALLQPTVLWGTSATNAQIKLKEDGTK